MGRREVKGRRQEQGVGRAESREMRVEKRGGGRRPEAGFFSSVMPHLMRHPCL